jgi:ADP-heptose:LPS heptosyltransferase
VNAPETWVFHRGALGDSVLLWPMLRALKRRGRAVTLVTDGSKGRLAAAELGIESLDAEQARFNRLWRADIAPEPVPGIAEVIAFAAGGTGATDAVWERNLRAMFPGAAIELLPGRPDSTFAREWARRGGGADLRQNRAGPVIVHVGAGSTLKRWPLARFAELTGRLAGIPIAGEVEAERFSAQENRVFREIGGQFLSTLDELAEMLRAARLVVACDSGPGHLAALLGVPTLSLFGPGDPDAWAPVGPRTRVVAPAAPSPMDWLEVDHALAEARALLAFP